MAEHEDWIRGLAADERFGRRDRLGSLHLVRPEVRPEVACGAMSGQTVSLVRRLVDEKNARGDGRPGYRLDVYMSESRRDGVLFGSSHVELDPHGYRNTHLDAFNHTVIDGRFYSGWPAVIDAAGPSVADFAGGIVTRAVYVDIPGARGTGWIDGDLPVTGADIDAALARVGAVFEPGDALLLDMGRDAYEAHGGTAEIVGVGPDGDRWLAAHDVSVLCADFVGGIALTWAIGLVHVIDCSFVALKAALSQRNRGPVGTLVVAPLPIGGATGANVNPLVLL
ncbi:MAG: cyclase family protein [Candidatus Limnocylindrales bacterium]|jgi:hypothetical protein